METLAAHARRGSLQRPDFPTGNHNFPETEPGRPPDPAEKCGIPVPPSLGVMPSGPPHPRCTEDSAAIAHAPSPRLPGARTPFPRSLFETLARTRLLPQVCVATGPPPYPGAASDGLGASPLRAEVLLPLARVLEQTGVPILEIWQAAEPPGHAPPLGELGLWVANLRTSHPGLLIGIGGLWNTTQLRLAREAGACFASSLGATRELLLEAKRLGLPLLPGVVTPTDVQTCLQEDFPVQKLHLPARFAGPFAGPFQVLSLQRLFAYTGARFVVSGDLGTEDLPDYAALPGLLALAGTFPCPPSLLRARQWEDVEARVRICLTRMSGQTTGQRCCGAADGRNSSGRSPSEWIPPPSRDTGTAEVRR